LKNCWNSLEFLKIEIFEDQKAWFFLVPYHFESFYASKCLNNSRLEGFVLFVYLSEFLLAVVLYYVVDVDLSGLEEGLCFLWVGMIADLDLLALDLELLELCVFHFFLRYWATWGNCCLLL
jgi:hypothetical protein